MLRKINTLFTNPMGVMIKYKRRLLYRYHGVIPPPRDEDYDHHWNYVSFENKTVLDLGADFGSTPSYFLYRGANQIIAVEGDPSLASKLCDNFVGDRRVIPTELMVTHSSDINSLIIRYRPDIVKMDIEGAEINLLECPDETLRSVKEWLIEAHNLDLCMKIRERFLGLGFSVTKVNYLTVYVIVATMSAAV